MWEAVTSWTWRHPKEIIFPSSKKKELFLVFFFEPFLVGKFRSCFFFSQIKKEVQKKKKSKVHIFFFVGGEMVRDSWIEEWRKTKEKEGNKVESFFFFSNEKEAKKQVTTRLAPKSQKKKSPHQLQTRPLTTLTTTTITPPPPSPLHLQKTLSFFWKVVLVFKKKSNSYLSAIPLNMFFKKTELEHRLESSQHQKKQLWWEKKKK
jgi:hypothetical protein